MRIRKSTLKRIIKEELTRVLSEVMAGSLFVERGGYGYISLSDDDGNEWGLGQAIVELTDAGINNIFGYGAVDGVDQKALDKILQQHEVNVQGGMERWDSDVFESYYNVDPERVIMAFAKLKGLEIKEAPAGEDELDDWGENDYPEQQQASREAAWEEQDY